MRRSAAAGGRGVGGRPARVGEPAAVGGGVLRQGRRRLAAAESAAASAAAESSAGADTLISALPEGRGAPSTAEPDAPFIPASDTASPFPGATPDTSNAIEGIPLVTSVLWERTRRNPIPVALVFGFLLALITLRRRRHGR